MASSRQRYRAARDARMAELTGRPRTIAPSASAPCPASVATATTRRTRNGKRTPPLRTSESGPSLQAQTTPVGKRIAVGDNGVRSFALASSTERCSTGRTAQGSSEASRSGADFPTGFPTSPGNGKSPDRAELSEYRRGDSNPETRGSACCT